MSTLRCFAALIGFAALSACATYLPRYSPADGAFETGYYENIATSRLALLEYRLGKYFAQSKRPYEVVCAAAENESPAKPDPAAIAFAPEVELKLIERFPGLSPLSRCVQDGLDVKAADTGVPAAIFDVNEFSCETPDTCLGWGGYYANGQHGWSYYRMRYVDGVWRIKPEDLGIVVT